MLPLILKIIGIACFAVLFTTASGVMQTFKHRYRIIRIKPFDCAMCFSWWSALIYFSVTSHNIFTAILYAAITSILSIYIEKIIRP